MNFLPDETSIVAVGAWNRAILSPEWIARHGMGHNDPVNYELELPVGGFGLPPRFVLLDLRFCVFPNRFEIRPVTQTLACLDLAERTLRAILNRLPHTPVQGVGFNFGCDADAPGDQTLAPLNAVNDLDVLDFAYEVTETTLTSSISFEGRVLNLSRSFSGGKLNLRFNFHHSFSSAAAAAESLRDAQGVFAEDYGYFRRVISTRYGIDMNPLSGGGNGN